MLVLIILCLFIALSIRTTPKGTGVFWGIQEMCLPLISLRVISLQILIVIPKGTGAFGGLKVVLCKLFYLFPTRVVSYSHYSQRDGCLLGTCRFMCVLVILCLVVALSIRTFPKGTGAFWGIPGQSFTKGREQFGEFQNHVFCNHPSSSERDGCLLWNSRFKFALDIIIL